MLPLEGMGSIPGQGTKIPNTAQCSPKKVQIKALLKNYPAHKLELTTDVSGGFSGGSDGKELACQIKT